MADLPVFSAADMTAARDSVRLEVTSALQSEHASALASLRAELETSFSARMTGVIEGAKALSPDNARLNAYFKATAKGMSPADAAELAEMIPAPAATSASAGRNADVAAVMAGQSPNVPALPGGARVPQPTEDQKSARAAQISGYKFKVS